MPLKRKTLAEVWPSGLSRYVSGRSTCGFRHWYKANHSGYPKAPSTFDSAKWNTEHTALLKETAVKMEADRWSCRLEEYFQVKGRTAVVKGKIDILAKRDGVTKVCDCKSGEPNEEHIIQVALYMLALPIAWESPKLYVVGEVVYPDHVVTVEPHQALELKDRIFSALREMGESVAPSKRPGELECRFCELTSASCDARHEAAGVIATTELF